MTKYAVLDEVFDIVSTGSFERLTEQQLINAYFESSECDAEIIKVFATEEEAVNCLEKMELCGAKEIDFHHGLVHIAFVQSIDVDNGKLGEVIKAKVGG